MISYMKVSMAEAFEAASQDATWNKKEQAALAAIAKGLFDGNWNQLYMAGYVQKDGRDWDGTIEDLLPVTAGVQRDYQGMGCGRGWASGHKEEFLVYETTCGWNIGRIGLPNLSEVKGALKRVTAGGYAINIVTEEGKLTRTEVSIWYEDGKVLGQGRVFRKDAISSVDCFDPTPEELSNSFLVEHEEAIMKECRNAPWM